MSNMPIVIDIEEWIKKAKSDPQKYTERQATEIFLVSLGTTQPYCGKFFLKGGTLMGIVYGSPRQTADLDYSTTIEPTHENVANLKEALNGAFARVSADLGYTDILCKVQSIKPLPKTGSFEQDTAPALKIKVGYAKRGGNQEKRLEENSAAQVLEVDISFNEPIGAIQVVSLASSSSHEFQAYSIYDLIAEKYRALMQQEGRNRYRRQDVYDIWMLLKQFDLDNEEKADLKSLIVKKCVARGIYPNKESLNDPQLALRAKSEWNTLALEIGELPDFDLCFDVVSRFYRALPWE